MSKFRKIWDLDKNATFSLIFRLSPRFLTHFSGYVQNSQYLTKFFDQKFWQSLKTEKVKVSKIGKILSVCPNVTAPKLKKFIFLFDYICTQDDKLHADTFKMILASKLSEL